MRSDRKPSLILPVAVTLAVLLGLYVGAYYATVVSVNGPDPYMAFGPMRPVIPVYRVQANPYLAETGWHLFFAPIHQLDRRIRPHVWEPSE